MSAEEIRSDLAAFRQEVAAEREEVQTHLAAQDTHISALEARIAELEAGGDISPSFAAEVRELLGVVREDVAGIFTPPNGGGEGGEPV